ncbi:hypothetical protein Sfulv_15320 [Streptomyces fulvorobeus]|uniref:Uncharacterized protein n=1 Tax=Streptomyces fulvorobeus TaxID=284028 RepID=A0A7J0C2M5_9ACTN|nr:hypothetical protein Sfulv_15320 [Streptomyces fulvorobeus]
MDAQLDIARRQAEGWRNFLTLATGLLTAVLILKGRDNVTELTTGYRVAVITLLMLAFASLLAAAFAAVSAAHGKPGDVLEYPDPRSLIDWETRERRRIVGHIRFVCRATAGGVIAVVAAVLLTWTAPAAEEKKPSTPLVTVRTPAGPVCGELVAVNARGLTLRVAPAPVTGDEAKDDKARGPAKPGVLRHVPWGPKATEATPAPTC